MKIVQLIIEIGFLIFASSALAKSSSYCIQGKQGIHCNYRTQEACDADAKDKEFCIPNPRRESSDIELQEPSAPSPYCMRAFFGNVCLQYPQEPCTDEEQNLKQDLRCDFN